MNLNLTYNDKIGSGGYATVYKYSVNDMTYAIKKASFFECESVFREVDFLSKINGLPNLMHLLDVKIYEGRSYLFLPLYDQTLYEFFNRSNDEIQLNTYKFVTDIATGIYYLHKNKIIHRDLNSRNILVKKVNDQFTFCITDLGISRISSVLDRTHKGQTKSDHYADHNFCAPEMHFKEDYDLPVDIWSFGHLISAYVTKTQCAKSQATTKKCITCMIPEPVLRQVFDSGKYNNEVTKVFSDLVDKIKEYTNIPNINIIADLFSKMIEVHPNNRITINQIVTDLNLNLDENIPVKRICLDVVPKKNDFITCKKYYEIVNAINTIYYPDHHYNIIRIIELFNRYVQLAPTPITNNTNLEKIIKMCVTIISCIFDIEPKTFDINFALNNLHIFNYQLTNPEVEILTEFVDKHIPVEHRKTRITEFFKQLCNKGINPLYLSVQEIYDLIKLKN